MHIKWYILIQISLMFIPQCPINNEPALVQIMIWRQVIIWANKGLAHWRMYALLGLDELTSFLATWCIPSLAMSIRVTKSSHISFEQGSGRIAEIMEFREEIPFSYYWALSLEKPQVLNIIACWNNHADCTCLKVTRIENLWSKGNGKKKTG